MLSFSPDQNYFTRTKMPSEGRNSEMNDVEPKGTEAPLVQVSK